MESIRGSCEGSSDYEDSSKLHDRPSENRRSYEQHHQQEHTHSRSPSPCLSSTSTSISSCEMQQQSKMMKNGIALSLHNSYASLYGSHPPPASSAPSNYSSLPFPIPSLSSSFQLPLSMPLPVVASSIMTSNKNSSSLHTPYSTAIVATTSGAIMTSSSNSITTVSTMGIPSRSLENNGVSSKNAIPGLVCLVCGDSSSGKHYGILACNGCSGFFKRSVRRRLIYRCQAGQGHCIIDKAHRNQCQACRLKKCLQMGMNKDAVQNERQPRNSATLRPEVLAEMDHERIIREAAAAVGAFGPPVSLAMGLASAAAHAHYVNGMARNNEHPVAALHAAAAVAAATANAAAQRAEIERDIVDRDRENSSGEEDRSPVTESPLPPPSKMMRNDSNGYQLVVSNSFRQSPAPLRLSHPQTPVISPTTSVSQTGMLQPPPLTPVVSVGPMPALSSVSTVGWMYPSDIQPQAHTTGLFPLQMQDNVYETAARLLFMSIKWAKSLPSFLGLPFRDQIILLEESWNELFLICAIQFCLPMDNCPLFSPAQFGQHLSSSTAAESGNANSKNTQQMSTDLRFLSELVTRFRAVAVDPAEFACLKAIILFKSETRGLKDPIQVENLQDQAQVMLNQHIRNQQPQRPARFGRLLLILPLLRQVSSFRLEHLYFRHTIGDTPMEKVLCDMYKN